MNFEDISRSYAFPDGHVLSISLEYEPKRITLKLSIRKLKERQMFEPCEVELVFDDVSELDIFEDFPTGGGFTDITFLKLNTGSFYLSLDPCGNSGLPHAEDNFIIKAGLLTLFDETGKSHLIS